MVSVKAASISPMVLALLSMIILSTPTLAAVSWTLTSSTFNQSSFEVQPYVSNGYIGQRLTVEGFGYKEIAAINTSAMDGTSGWPLFDPRFTAAMVAGFYDQQDSTTGTNFAQTGGEQPISTVPTWSSLYLTVDNSTYTVGVDPSQISNWTQSMSIENGVVSTSLTWRPSTASTSSVKFNSSDIMLNYTIFAHRKRPNLAVVRLDVSGLTDALTVTITDVLDGAGAWRTTTVGKGLVPDGTDSIYSAVQPSGISNVTAFEISRLTFEAPSSGKATNSTECFSGVSQNASTASMCYSVKPSNGKLTAIKYVGIATSDAFKGVEMKTALKATTDAVSEGYDSLLKEHSDAWGALWEESDIIIPGDSAEMKELQLVTRASFFHLLSNVRQGSEPTGLGDNSIAPAGLTSDSYAGQVFWDADTWMFPSLNALYPTYAESITNYRSRQLGAAEQNAQMFNRSGALYPWTAARFGNCTGVGPCFNYEYHLENDISMAQFQYYASTQNKTWLKTKGWPVISNIAEFWASQVVFNDTTHKYDTRNETDPDEFANFRNNAAYTNAGISVTLQNAIQLAGQMGITPPKNWTIIGNKITVLSDNSSGIILEYDGFNGTTAVKQADVVLLTYPLEYNQTQMQGLLDLDFYALATSPNGPGMTYSMFSIDASTLSPVGCASYTYLIQASQPYNRGPFYQFSEQTTDSFETNGGTNPAYTFITGHGGFLQSLTHGFTGYRSRTNAFYLDPTLPIQLENYTVKGMKWLDSTFDVTLSTKETIITRRKGTTSTAPVEIGPSNAKAGNHSLKVGESLVVPTSSTNGTLVSGNLAQCKTVVNRTDTSFTIGTDTIVPGQYAIAAIDGSNATTWQPLTNTTANMTIDLGSPQHIRKLHFNWNANPAKLYAVSGGKSVDAMTALASGNVDISAPYNSSNAEAVSIKVGNLTEVVLDNTVMVQFLTISISGSFSADGRGATLAEVAVM